MVCALGAAVCFGTATVFQAVAARAAAGPAEAGRGGAGTDAALLLRALRQWCYLAGLTLDGLGFLLQIAALRSLRVIGETIGPAAVGVVWLGDRTRDGLAWMAVLGFAVAVAGALALARFGEAPVARTPAGTVRVEEA